MEEAFVGKAVMAVVQIKKHEFVVCITSAEFCIYDREKKVITRQINNPSSSINYNCLLKTLFFSDDMPYLVYKDSRSIGVINCVTYEATMLA